MNTFKAIFTLVFAIFSFQLATANNTPATGGGDNVLIIETEANTKNTVDLRLLANASPKLTIHLKDATGKVVYFEKVKDQRHYFRRFSLAEVPDGEYYFSIRKADTDETIKHFVLENGVVTFDSNNDVILSDESAATTAVGLQSVDDQSVNLVCTNPTNSKVTLRLVDNAGKVWFFTKVKPNENYAKRLQLDALPQGDYEWQLDNQKMDTKQDLRIDETGVKVKSDLPRA
ncbi:MAG: hypothetical protein AB8G22_24695 [Saprospiraceae bacterium]